MELKCPKCGEPWDFDSLHEETDARHPSEPWRITGKHDQAEYEKYFDRVRQDFRRDGCAAFRSFGARCTAGEADPAIGALMDIMGDDLDGVAAMIEDFNL